MAVVIVIFVNGIFWDETSFGTERGMNSQPILQVVRGVNLINFNSNTNINGMYNLDIQCCGHRDTVTLVWQPKYANYECTENIPDNIS